MADVFNEILFPEDIEYGATGGAEYSTAIAEDSAGGEQRNQNWDQPRGTWDVAHALKNQTQLDKLLAFFHNMAGRAYGFRFKDWSDYKAVGSNLGVGNGVNKIFQLRKSYTVGPITKYRKITKPVWHTAVDASNVPLSDSIVLYLDGAQQLGSAWSVDATTGLITFTVAPPNNVVVTADFEFHIPVRFDTDKIAVKIAYYNTFEWASIPLKELRPR